MPRKKTSLGRLTPMAKKVRITRNNETSAQRQIRLNRAANYMRSRRAAQSQFKSNKMSETEVQAEKIDKQLYQLKKVIQYRKKVQENKILIEEVEISENDESTEDSSHQSNCKAVNRMIVEDPLKLNINEENKIIRFEGSREIDKRNSQHWDKDIVDIYENNDSNSTDMQEDEILSHMIFVKEEPQTDNEINEGWNKFF